MKEENTWIIGDIHGMFDPLRRLINRILDWDSRCGALTHLLFLGDYIDYGPSSKEVVDLILELRKNYKVTTLAGNHEDMMLQFITESELFEQFGNMWFRGAGGQDTVHSFMNNKESLELLCSISGSDFSRENFKLPRKYQKFFEELKYAHKLIYRDGNKEYKFGITHSTLFRPREKLRIKQRDEYIPSIDEQLSVKNYKEFHELRRRSKIWIEDLHIWNRTEPVEKFGDWILVHGHTPTQKLKRYYVNTGQYEIEPSIPYISFQQQQVSVENLPLNYLYYASLNDIISIDLDTGAVYGEALSALCLNKSLLFDENRLTCIQVYSNKSHRSQEDTRIFHLTFTG